MSVFLVTGGAGFIGSHLAETLVKKGFKVRLVDNFSTGLRKNIEHIINKIELIEADITDLDICREIVRDVSVVFHQAAVPSVPRSVEDPITSHKSNVDGTFNLLVAAKEAKVKRFIYAASSSAYGDTEISPKYEQILPQPKSPYAVNKLVGEYYCKVFYECFGLQTISLRYFNVFGPRQNPKSQYAAAIPAFVTAILEDKPPIVYGDGEQSRDFTYIDNVIEANLLAASAPELHGEVVNIACGRSITVNQIIEKINKLLGKDIRPVYTSPRPGDVRHSLADIRLAKEIIGYSPIVHFEEGLEKTIEWYKENAEFWRS